MDVTAQSVWNNCLEFIKDNIQPQAYKTWFEPIIPVKLSEDVLSIQVPSKFFYEWLEEHYVKILRIALTKELKKVEWNEVENISKNVTKLYGDGYVLTGNSAEFLDPVFSSGVSFATESGLLAAKLILKTFKNEPVNWQQDYVDYIKKGVNVFSTYVKEWYSGNLQTIFFNKEKDDTIKRQLCAVLAGYVWDDTNPFVKKHERVVRNLAKIIA